MSLTWDCHECKKKFKTRSQWQDHCGTKEHQDNLQGSIQRMKQYPEKTIELIKKLEAGEKFTKKELDWVRNI